MNITRGPIKTAIRLGVYGIEGVGKTTFASQLPGCVFIDTEGSTKHMDVARFDPPETYQDVLNDIDYVIQNPGEIGTLVIDTVDWLEKLVFRAVCAEKKIDAIEDLGYGKGYVYAKEKVQKLLEKLDGVIAKGVHVCLVCHSMIRKFELPDEMGSYDRYMLKLNEKNIAPLIKEWVDMLLFVNYKTDVVTASDGKTKKGKGGQKRVMYTNHTACWDAKNRFGLPDEMPFDYGQIGHLFGEAPPVEPVRSDPKPAARAPEKPAAKAPGELPPAAATVTKTRTVQPENEALPAGKPAAKPEPAARGPVKRPPEMASENEEKDGHLAKLWELMKKDNVTDPLILRAVVAEKDYYNADVPVKDYDTGFIRDVLIEAWDQVGKLCVDKTTEAPF